MFAGGFQNGSTKKYQNSLLLFSKIRHCYNREFWKGNVFCSLRLHICIRMYIYIYGL